MLIADEVTIDNWKQFEAQLKRDLPVGTCFKGIKRYLESLGFEHATSYSEQLRGDFPKFQYGYSPYDNTLEAGIRDLDRWLLVFITQLAITIDRAKEEKCLTGLKVWLWDIGP